MVSSLIFFLSQVVFKMKILEKKKKKLIGSFVKVSFESYRFLKFKLLEKRR